MDHIPPNLGENLAIERAKAKDVAAIRRMVEAAYSIYTERLGRLPAPMTADHEELVQTQNVFVLRLRGEVVGSVLLFRHGDSIKVNNLVVDPSAQGCGYGRFLMEYAERTAREHGLCAVTLFTNEKMLENIALYTKIGFVEIGRKTEDGFRRVYFRKRLHEQLGKK
jgi:GNAT superfamily N-acetyltransferase